MRPLVKIIVSIIVFDGKHCSRSFAVMQRKLLFHKQVVITQKAKVEDVIIMYNERLTRIYAVLHSGNCTSSNHLERR